MMYTSWESNLMRIGWIQAEMQTIFQEYPPMEPSEGFHLRAIVRYYRGIRLNDFILARKMLCKNLREQHRLQLDASLKEFWEPIAKHEEAIRKLRNSYLAHLQEKENFEKHIIQILIDYKYPPGHGDARFFAGCAWKYCEGIIANFPEEFKEVSRKNKLAIPATRLPTKIPDLLAAESKLAKAQEKANAELTANGFQSL